MKRFIRNVMFVIGVVGMVGSAHAEFGSGLGKTLKDTAAGAAKGATSEAAMAVSTTCSCKNGAPDDSCKAMGAEIGNKIKSAEAADGVEASKIWYNCEIQDVSLKASLTCAEQLRNQWVALGVRRTRYNSSEGGTGGTKVSCLVSRSTP